MSPRKFNQRWADRGDHGLSLVEVVVGMMILGLVSILIMSMFQTTNSTANVVSTGTVSITTAQVVSQDITQELRQAANYQVSSSGSRLDVERGDGTCRSWVYNDSSLYVISATNAKDFPGAGWIQRLMEVSPPTEGSIFTNQDTGVAYSFIVGEAAGRAQVSGSSFLRLANGEDGSVCFSSEEGDPTPEPSPTPTEPSPTIYTISYDLDGGTAGTPANPAIYTAVTPGFTLSNPARAGYNFSGWTGTGLSAPTMTVVIPTGNFGNRAYKATWTQIVAPAALDQSRNYGGPWLGGGNYGWRVTNTTGSTAHTWTLNFTPSGGTIIALNIDGGLTSCAKTGSSYTCQGAGSLANGETSWPGVSWTGTATGLTAVSATKTS